MKTRILSKEKIEADRAILPSDKSTFEAWLGEDYQYLLELSDVNALDNNNQTALDYAISIGSKEQVEFLLDHGALPISPQNPTVNDIPLIHRAIKSKHEEIALMLLKKFPALEGQLDCYKNTPLISAIEGQCLKVVDYLINQKSTINWANNQLITPLWLAASLGLDSQVS